MIEAALQEEIEEPPGPQIWDRNFCHYILRADKRRGRGTEFDFAELLQMQSDNGVTNLRNTNERPGEKPNTYWRPRLGPANHCLVPFTSFAEPDQHHERTRSNIWFALC